MAFPSLTSTIHANQIIPNKFSTQSLDLQLENLEYQLLFEESMS